MPFYISIDYSTVFIFIYLYSYSYFRPSIILYWYCFKNYRLTRLFASNVNKDLIIMIMIMISMIVIMIMI